MSGTPIQGAVVYGMSAYHEAMHYIGLAKQILRIAKLASIISRSGMEAQKRMAQEILIKIAQELLKAKIKEAIAAVNNILAPVTLLSQDAMNAYYTAMNAYKSLVRQARELQNDVHELMDLWNQVEDFGMD